VHECMTELIRSPTAMARVQAEVREAFKSKSTITEEDISRADADADADVYLKLVIKETLRMHTQLPLLIPRRCRRTCRIMGYDIPEGTTVMVDVWAICRDPVHWDDPEQFMPERFENRSLDLDYKGTNKLRVPPVRLRPSYVPRRKPWAGKYQPRAGQPSVPLRLEAVRWRWTGA
jgi:cytochrome P450